MAHTALISHIRNRLSITIAHRKIDCERFTNWAVLLVSVLVRGFL
jgi:hypothetical protein